MTLHHFQGIAFLLTRETTPRSPGRDRSATLSSSAPAPPLREARKICAAIRERVPLDRREEKDNPDRPLGTMLRLAGGDNQDPLTVAGRPRPPSAADNFGALQPAWLPSGLLKPEM